MDEKHWGLHGIVKHKRQRIKGARQDAGTQGKTVQRSAAWHHTVLYWGKTAEKCFIEAWLCYTNRKPKNNVWEKPQTI